MKTILINLEKVSKWIYYVAGAVAVIIAVVTWGFSNNNPVARMVNNQTVLQLNKIGETKYIIKDVPVTTYPPYHDGRRIRPSSTNPVYEFNLSNITPPSNMRLHKMNIAFERQYYADSNYDPAEIRLDIIYPPTSNSTEKTISSSTSFDGPLKNWITENMEIDIAQGVPPEKLKFFATQSGDLAFLIRNMQVDAIFGNP